MTELSHTKLNIQRNTPFVNVLSLLTFDPTSGLSFINFYAKNDFLKIKCINFRFKHTNTHIQIQTHIHTVTPGVVRGAGAVAVQMSLSLIT